MSALLFVLCLAASPAPPPASEARAYHEELGRILKQSEFRAEGRDVGIDDFHLGKKLPFFGWIGDAISRLVDRFWRWFWDLLRSSDSDRPSRTLFPKPSWATGLLVCAGVVLLALALSRMRRPRREGARVGSAAAVGAGGEGAQALEHSPERWQRFVHEFARSGEFRLALRATYLRVLALLQERGVIHCEPQYTNADYLDSLRTSPAYLPFAELTRAFDEAWYGNKPFGSAGLEAALTCCRKVDGLTGGTS